MPAELVSLYVTSEGAAFEPAAMLLVTVAALSNVVSSVSPRALAVAVKFNVPLVTGLISKVTLPDWPGSSALKLQTMLVGVREVTSPPVTKTSTGPVAAAGRAMVKPGDDTGSSPLLGIVTVQTCGVPTFA